MFLRILRKTAYLLALVIAVLFTAVFLFISPIAEFFIEKYSVEYTGRQIQLDNLRINLLNGVVKADHLKIYEAGSKQEFLGIESIFVNTDLYSFVNGNNRIREISLFRPVINIRQTGEHFNFDDLITRFADTTATVDTTPSEPVKYLLQNLKINEGIINYACTSPAIIAGIGSLNLDCKQIAWDDPLIKLNSDFLIKSGGKTKAGFQYNIETADYSLNLDLQDFNISLLYPYLRDYLYVHSLDGFFSTQLNLNGNAGRPADIAASGLMEVIDFSIVDTTAEKLVSVGTMRIPVDSLNSGQDIYYFGNISLDRPFIRFAMYDNGYNFDRIMAESETSDTLTGEAPVEEFTNIFRMIAGYIAYFTNEYKISNYKADSFELTNGELVYTDYTLEDKFLYHLDSLQLHSRNLNSSDERLLISLDAVMNTSGLMNGTLSVNPDGFSEMDIRYTIRELLLSDINPYSVYYVATPFVQGRLFFENVTSIKDQKLRSENRLRIDQAEVGEKVKNSTAMSVPVKLAISLLKDLEGNINLTIPVVGDLNDPTFKWGKALLQVLKNIAIKAAVAPYRLIAGMFGGDEEQYKEIRMNYLQTNPGGSEMQVLENLSKVLQGKPELNIGLVQQTNTQHEIELLALFRAKQEYAGFGTGDSTGLPEMNKINSIFNRDSLFNVWVDSKTGQNQGLESIQQKVVKYCGYEKLKAEVERREALRSAGILNYFTSGGINVSRIRLADKIVQSEQASQTGPSFKISYFINGEDIPSEEP
ncbi:MAG: DUF748 domain-containing protein [Lentimicrobium sp.]